MKLLTRVMAALYIILFDIKMSYNVYERASEGRRPIRCSHLASNWDVGSDVSRL